MKGISRARPRKTPTQRAAILAAFERSTLSSHQFARQHRIAASTLFRWLRQAPAPTPARAAALIEVPNLIAPHPPAPPYRLRFANGVSVEIAPGFQPEEVRTLAQLVRGL